jgi:hypothetical protein
MLMIDVADSPDVGKVLDVQKGLKGRRKTSRAEEM